MITLLRYTKRDIREVFAISERYQIKPAFNSEREGEKREGGKVHVCYVRTRELKGERREEETIFKSGRLTSYLTYTAVLLATTEY